VTVPTITVNLELNQIVAGEFVVGSSLVGGADLIGDGLTDIQSSSIRCSIRRGRWGQVYEDFEAGSLSLVINNENRLFDPSHASGTYYGELVPGRNVEIVAGGVTIMTAFVEDYDLEYDVSGRSVTALKGTDALGRLGAIQFDAWTSSQLSATGKLTAVCDRSEVAWTGTLREFIPYNLPLGFSGEPELQSDSVTWGSNVLAYMQLIARSNFLSFIYASATGVLTLRPVFSWTIFNAPSLGAVAATFGGANIPFQTISAQYGNESLFAEVSVDYEGGTAQTESVADPVAWFDAYGPLRRLSIPSTLLATAGLASDMATELLAYFDTPTFRITEFSTELAALGTSDQTTVLSVDIGETISISFTPNSVGSAISQTLIVQGIAHDITPDSHVVTFSVRDYLA
jgi:hypothetical protein